MTAPAMPANPLRSHDDIKPIRGIAVGVIVGGASWVVCWAVLDLLCRALLSLEGVLP